MRSTRIRYERLSINSAGLAGDLPCTLNAGGLLSSAYCSSLFLCLLLVGCESTPHYAPVSDRAVAEREKIADKSGIPSEAGTERVNVYIIKKGDTLYSIAVTNGINPRDLAEWNNISDPSAIHVGQELYLSAPAQLAQPSLFPLRESAPPSATATKPDRAYSPEAKLSVNTAKLKTEPKAFKLPYSEQAVVQLKKGLADPPPVMLVKAAPAIEKNTSIEINPASRPSLEAISPEAITDDDHVEWIWPAKGKVSESFSESTKGIDIAGTPGQAVTASAAGKVVYSGAGLRGYGKLIIIKHNNTYLSAYAHNNKLLVKEGQTVAKGQKIAEMGNTDTNLVKLHFEIRKNGKPVDPLKHLPGISG